MPLISNIATLRCDFRMQAISYITMTLIFDLSDMDALSLFSS